MDDRDVRDDRMTGWQVDGTVPALPAKRPYLRVPQLVRDAALLHFHAPKHFFLDAASLGGLRGSLQLRLMLSTLLLDPRALVLLLFGQRNNCVGESAYRGSAPNKATSPHLLKAVQLFFHAARDLLVFRQHVERRGHEDGVFQGAWQAH